MPEFAPGVKKTAVVPMTNPTAKVFDYTAELYMGVNLALMASADFHLNAGETKDISLSVTMPTEAGTYPVHIGVFSGGENIALYHATEDVIIPVGAARITDVSWEISGVSGTLGGILVKATVTVSSPKAFSGKIEIGIPDMIASNVLLTPEQQQALIDYYEQKRAECTDSTCRHHYDLILESRRGDPMTGGFYDSGINGRETREDVEEHHIDDIAKGVSSRTYPHLAGMYFDFPAGSSQVVVGFFMKADEAHYRISDSATLYCIGYQGGVFSPEVKLYEGSTLVDDVIYTGAVNFDQWYTGNRCTLPWGAYPISASVPDSVKSGENSFWASHTVYLTYMPGYEYKVTLYARPCRTFYSDLHGHDITICADWILAYRDYYCGSPWRDDIIRLDHTGEVTFEGLIGTTNTWDYEYGVKSPAWAMYTEGGEFPTWRPVPPGVYTVYSRCIKRLGPPSFAGVETIWDDVDMGINIVVT